MYLFTFSDGRFSRAEGYVFIIFVLPSHLSSFLIRFVEGRRWFSSPLVAFLSVHRDGFFCRISINDELSTRKFALAVS